MKAKKQYVVGERLAGDHRDERTGEWKRVHGKFQGTTLAGSVTIEGMQCAPNSVKRLKKVRKPSWEAHVDHVHNEVTFSETPTTQGKWFTKIKVHVHGATTTLKPGDKVKLVVV